MIILTFNGTDAALIQSIQGKAEKIITALRVKLDILDIQLQAKIVGEKLHGQVLNQRTGKGAASVRFTPAFEDGTELTGSVLAGGGPAFYLRFQHDGTKGPYPIVPTNKKALAFMMNGKQVFAKMVMHPGLTAKPFATDSLNEMTPDFVTGLQEALNEAV